MKNKQTYIIITRGNSRMGASADYDFVDEDQLSNIGFYAEFVEVYPVGKKLTKTQKKKMGMGFLKK